MHVRHTYIYYRSLYVCTYVSYVCLLYNTSTQVPSTNFAELPSPRPLEPNMHRWLHIHVDDPTCMYPCSNNWAIYIRTYVLYIHRTRSIYIMQLTSAHISSPIAIGRKEKEERKRKEKKNTILIVSKFQPNARKKKKEGSDRIRFIWVNKCALLLHIFPSLGFMYGIVCIYVCTLYPYRSYICRSFPISIRSTIHNTYAFGPKLGKNPLQPTQLLKFFFLLSCNNLLLTGFFASNKPVYSPLLFIAQQNRPPAPGSRRSSICAEIYIYE